MEQFKCSGDCLKCHPNQRQYCACQFTYNTMRKVEDMQGTIAEMKVKIEAIQGNEASLFDPTKEASVLGGSTVENQPIAQEGSGAAE